MEYRNLGRTGVRVSTLCLGCMNFGGRTSEDAATALINYAIGAGINFVDTANVYGYDSTDYPAGRGKSEEIVGKALKQTGTRQQIVLATKVHFPMSNDPNAQGNSRRHIIEQCEASLRRLQTDWIDLYQLHQNNNDIPIDETLRALDDLICSGKVRYIGTSTFAAWQIVESLWVSKEYNLNRFVCEQPAYNLLDRRIERELVPMAQTYGIGLIPWSPTAAGFLAGRYRRGEPVPKGARLDEFWGGVREAHLVSTAFDVLDVVETIAQEKSCSPAQLALAWCQQQPGITSPIIGPRTCEQLEDCLGSLAVKLIPEDIARLDQIAPPGRVTVPYYGADGQAWTTWGPHWYRW